MSSITVTNNCLGKKVVDDFDLIFEFGVGRNFGVQGGNLPVDSELERADPVSNVHRI